MVPPKSSADLLAAVVEQSTDQLRVALICHYYPPHVGGIENVVREQAERLAARGHDVSVVTSSCADRPGVQQLGGIRLARAGAWNFFERYGIPFPIFGPGLVRAAWRAVRSAEVVHIHDVQYVSSWVAALCAWLQRKPYLITQHVDIVDHPRSPVRWVQQLVFAALGRPLLRRAQQIFVLNDRVYDFVRTATGSNRQIQVLANGVDTTKFRPASAERRRRSRLARGWAPTEIIAIFVGRPVPKKGYEVFSRISLPGVRLVLAGAKSPASQTGAAPEKPVQFLGILSSEELASAYQDADIFVLPSRGEGFPLTVQEAMACGLPIVTTKDPAYACYELDPTLLRLVPAELAEVSAAIADLSADPKLRQEMSRYSRAQALAQFDWSVHLAELESQYRRAVNS